MKIDRELELHLIPDMPPIDGWYWAVLLSACSMGETGADLLSHTLKWGYAWSSLLLGIIFLTAMFFELRGIGPKTARYWFAIVATATVGTTLADLTSRTFHLGYALSSALMIALFAVIFLTWRRASGRGMGDAIHYWAAILVASVMGTTLGDFLSNDSGLGFGKSALLLAGLLGSVFAIAHLTKISREILYWAALVLTSTFGAAMGDYMTKDEGLKLGTYLATGILIGILIVVIALASAVGRRPHPAPVTSGTD